MSLLGPKDARKPHAKMPEQRVKTEQEKEKTPSDEPTVHLLVASDELQRKSKEDSSTG
jgi:hypothetical protein